MIRVDISGDIAQSVLLADGIQGILQAAGMRVLVVPKQAIELGSLNEKTLRADAIITTPSNCLISKKKNSN